MDKYHTVRLNVSVPEDYEADTDTTDTVGAAGGASAAQDCVFTLTTVEEGKKFKLRGALRIFIQSTRFSLSADLETRWACNDSRRRSVKPLASIRSLLLRSLLP